MGEFPFANGHEQKVERKKTKVKTAAGSEVRVYPEAIESGRLKAELQTGGFLI